MLYIVHVCLSIKGSFDIRKLLHQNGFAIYLENRYTLKIRELIEDYEDESRNLLPLLDEQTYVFRCVYNSPFGYPEQEVFLTLMSRNEVESYTIEHRKKW